MLPYVHKVCQRVTALQEEGEQAAAAEVLHSLLVVLAVQPGGYQGLWEEGSGAKELLGETAYLLAIRLLQQGAPAPADRLLFQLGFRHRLATPAFQPCSAAAAAAPAAVAATVGSPLAEPPQQQQQPAVAPSGQRLPAQPPLVMEAPLSAGQLAALQRGFRPAAAFWEEHGYWGDSCGFFSYLCPLLEPLRHPIEEAIAALRQRLAAGGGAGGGSDGAAPGAVAGCASTEAASAAASLAEKVRQATHAEWWVHCRDPSAPHQLHFDADETAMRAGRARYRLAHPLAGSLLVVEGRYGLHGPTLVLDQIPTDMGLAERGWLVQPETGRYVVFQGDLLHGVMPGPPVPAGDQQGEGDSGGTLQLPRTTLMVAWWEFDAAQLQRLEALRAGKTAAAAGGGEEGGLTAGGVAGPMQLPPWRRPAGEAGACRWPGEFVSQEQQLGCQAAGERSSSNGGPEAAAVAGEEEGPGAADAAVAAVTLLQPAWVPISCGGSEPAGGSLQSGSDELAGSAAAARDGAGDPSPQQHEEEGEEEEESGGCGRLGRAAKRARREAGELQEGPRLPLLYPPLRYFLFGQGDIRAGYTLV